MSYQSFTWIIFPVLRGKRSIFWNTNHQRLPLNTLILLIEIVIESIWSLSCRISKMYTRIRKIIFHIKLSKKDSIGLNSNDLIDWYLKLWCCQNLSSKLQMHNRSLMLNYFAVSKIFYTLKNVSLLLRYTTEQGFLKKKMHGTQVFTIKI